MTKTIKTSFDIFFCNIYKNIFIKVEINFCDVTKWPEICFKFDFWLLTLYYKVLSFSCLQQNIIDLILHPWRGGCRRSPGPAPPAATGNSRWCRYRTDGLTRWAGLTQVTRHAHRRLMPVQDGFWLDAVTLLLSLTFFDNIVLSASLFKNLELHMERSTEDHDVTEDFTSDHKVHKNVY